MNIMILALSNVMKFHRKLSQNVFKSPLDYWVVDVSHKAYSVI